MVHRLRRRDSCEAQLTRNNKNVIAQGYWNDVVFHVKGIKLHAGAVCDGGILIVSTAQMLVDRLTTTLVPPHCFAFYPGILSLKIMSVCFISA